MESGSQVGTYIAYGFVCLFLLVVAIAAARSYGMIMSLVLMVFLGNTKPGKSPADEEQEPDAEKKLKELNGGNAEEPTATTS